MVSPRRLGLGALAVTAALTLTACGGGKNDPASAPPRDGVSGEAQYAADFRAAAAKHGEDTLGFDGKPMTDEQIAAMGKIGCALITAPGYTSPPDKPFKVEIEASALANLCGK